MGHERIGILPKTKPWRLVVQAIAESADSGASGIASAARQTLENVSNRFSSMHKDSGVKAAFGYLLALTSSHLPQSEGMSSPEVKLEDDPSPVRLAQQLNEWVRKHADSREYAEMACRAAGNTIAEWTHAQTRQGHLFEEKASAKYVWAKSANASGFCQVARSFFAHLTERYLRYFLEREASAELSTLSARQEFERNLHDHVEDVSKHAFETSKITQSFAAGWYNDYVRNARPSDKEIESFLAVAFGKLQEELRRELLK